MLTLPRTGLRDFIINLARPLAYAIGEAWSGGSLRVFEEHILTALLTESIEAGIRPLPKPPVQAPLALLATLSQEQHTLGLLMLRALLAMSRVRCLWVGSLTLNEIAECAQEHQADVVALSLSNYFPRNRARIELRELRAMLDSSIHIWAGGAGVRSLPVITGIVRMQSLEDALSAVPALIDA